MSSFNLDSIKSLKRTRSFGLTVGLTVANLFVLGLLSACAPGEVKVPVEITPPLTQKLRQCYDGAVQSKVTAVRGAGAVTVCEVPDTDAQPDLFPIHSLQRSQKHEQVKRNVNYGLVRKSDRLMVTLQVGLELPGGMGSTAHYNHVIAQLEGQCLRQIDSVWRRSVPDVRLGVDVVFVPPGQLKKESLDQLIRFQLADASRSIGEVKSKLESGAESPGSAGGPSDPYAPVASDVAKIAAADEFPELVLANWPERAKFYPFGRANDRKACEQSRRGQNVEACEQKANAIANDGFCLSLATLVGHWVGLPADPSAPNECNADSAASYDPNPSGSIGLENGLARSQFSGELNRSKSTSLLQTPAAGGGSVTGAKARESSEWSSGTGSEGISQCDRKSSDPLCEESRLVPENSVSKVKARGKPTPVPQATAGYMKLASQVSSDQFFRFARLNANEIGMIFGPMCRDLGAPTDRGAKPPKRETLADK